jgi:hypothetical protein
VAGSEVGVRNDAANFDLLTEFSRYTYVDLIILLLGQLKKRD